MGLNVPQPSTDRQVAVESFIFNICIDNQIEPQELEQLAHKLAAFYANADAKTNGEKHEANYYSRDGY
ncbi:hypothetical protein NGK36_17180 [Hafnia alvei]|uniref:hypothetical protein n=1 Tax=Hafnia alvei TaxID=569 RepID=UPI002DBBB40B|nr:hypothetical protein [Hafnia alvei]MEB7891005.1 hypothetical protein [Hafnia alvei]